LVSFGNKPVDSSSCQLSIKKSFIVIGPFVYPLEG
jgi:hypothetical protein